MNKVLIVEDEVLIAEDLKDSLEALGYLVPSIVSSGEEAVKQAGKLQPDIILMDIQLRDRMDGVEAANIIYSKFQIPIIFLTAHADSALLDRAKRVGSFGYILKPFDDHGINAAIEIALYRQKTEIELLNHKRKIQSSEKRFKTIFSSMLAGVVIVDQATRIIEDANKAALKIIGLPRKKVIGKKCHEFICPAKEGDCPILDHNQTIENKERILRGKDGAETPIVITVSKIKMAGKSKLIESFLDISKLKKTEADLLKSQQYFHGVVENSKDAIIVTSRDGTIQYMNSKAEQVFGVVGKSMLGDVFDVPATVEQPTEIDILRSNGERGVGDMRASETYWLNDEAYLITIRDITERKRIENRLSHLAGHDSLTGTMNRRGFEEVVSRELDRAIRYNNQGALLWFDLDDFKKVNDSYGHNVGDNLLMSISDILKKRMRKSDILARIGGDEFAILLPGVDLEQSIKVAEQIIELVNTASVAVNGDVVRTSPSIGIVLFPDHGIKLGELLARADIVMYQAKEKGRNCYQVYDPAGDQQAESRLQVALTEKIRVALEQDLFAFYVQPIICSATEETHFEILLRLKDNDTVIAPGAFLPHAERVGLIREIDRWVLINAFHVLGIIQSIDPQAHFNINISGKSLVDDQFVFFLEEQIANSSIAPARITIEITETAAISNILLAQEFIHRLNDLGCLFALDDFGVGFASFYHLKHLPVQFLKIDGGFIRNIINSEEDQYIVQAMCNVAKGLRKKTVAEWVENEETRVLLESYGVDYLQGYHLGKPMPIEQRWKY